MWILRPEHQEIVHPVLLDGWAAISQLRAKARVRPSLRPAQPAGAPRGPPGSVRLDRDSSFLIIPKMRERDSWPSVHLRERLARWSKQGRSHVGLIALDREGLDPQLLQKTGSLRGGLARHPAVASHSSDQTPRSWDRAHQR